MTPRFRRLRDFFNPPKDAAEVSVSLDTDDLIDAIAADDPVDVEESACSLMHSHRRLWHDVEDEITEDLKRRR